jgi:surface antigen
MLIALILALLTTGLVALNAKPALADTTLCSGSSYSTCTSAGYSDNGYSTHSSTSYWSMYSGHNCTNYVAYVEQTTNGAPTPSYSLGNAYQWASQASAHGVTVNGTPGAGSVAQWNAASWNTNDGHVAYVEGVNGDGSITVSEDSYPSGPFDWRVIPPSSPYWPNNFIHFKDLSSSNTQMMITGDSSVYAKTSIGYGGWVSETGPGNAQAIAVGGGYQVFLRGDSAVFAKNSVGGGGWVQETDRATANQIAVGSTGVQMMRTSDAAVYDKNTIGYGGWTQVAAPGNATAIAVGGNTEMFIRGDAAVFAKTYGSVGWTQETSPGNATAIAVSSTGVQMFIRGDGAVFATNSIGGPWTQETSPGNAQAIAVGGNTQMFLRGDSTVFATNSIGGPWTQETSPANAVAIAVGADGTQLFRRGDSAVFATNSIGGAWTQETDPGTASAIAAG